MYIEIPSTLKQEHAGNKAWYLKKLYDADYAVPNFVVLPTTVVTGILNSSIDVTQVVTECFDYISDTQPLIIRSSAQGEDTAVSAAAGQFHTSSNVDPANLAEAIVDCIHHIKNQPSASAGTLALIIQTYLTPTRHGVLFTRHPEGKQTMVLEYGTETSVVAGEAATRLEYHKNDLPKNSSLPYLSPLTKIGIDLEKQYGWPQDIEWLEHNNTFYLVQTRNITSIKQATWKGLIAAEKTLNTQPPPYYYQQTTVVEQFPHPRPLAISLLRSLYLAGGPVDTTYRNVGIKYQPTNIHRMIAGTLYINKEAELQSIFPSHSYFTSHFGEPRFANWNNLGTSVKNFWVSTFLRTNDTTSLLKRITIALETPLPTTTSPTKRWEAFLDIYPLVYEINLRTQKVLSLLPKNTGISAGSIDHSPLDAQAYGLSPHTTVGNSLSLDDTSTFTAYPPSHKNPDKPHSSARETLYIRARSYLALREYSRWLTVKYLHHLRADLDNYAQAHIPNTPNLIYYTTWVELQTDQLDCKLLQRRADIYKNELALEPPQELSSHSLLSVKKTNTNTGLAPGIAAGTLRTVDTLETNSNEAQILYTKTLYPELTKYFPYLQGIVTANGGTLSHLAIMARERQIPVIRTSAAYPELHQKWVEINGNTGTLHTKE